jgi:hypothetical protein
VKGPSGYTARKLRPLIQAACSCVFLALSVWVPAWAEPTIEGTLETGGYVYTPRPYDFAGTGATQYRIYENVSFDATFNADWSFHFNTRVGYQSQRRESQDGVILNFYYGYVEYSSDRLDFQFGRIVDFTNLVYLYFDGAKLEGKMKAGDNRINLGCYGGVIVRDDYLEEYGNPYVLRTFNSTDYRSLFISQRLGDYVAGATLSVYAPKAVIFGADYQIVFNRNALAEHYASLNIETAFSKKVKLYGYGTLDLVQLLPSNTLAAIQIDPVDTFSLIVAHEYYRPVFLKHSYFWTYFAPFGNQDVSATFIFPITKTLTLDARYGAIFYDSTSEAGQELNAAIEQRNINRFGVKAEAGFITGPEGNLVTLQMMLKRRVLMVGLVAGGGIEFYNDSKLTDGYSRGYFATLGADIEIVKQVILALSGECSGNQDTRYDVRGTFSLKYNF